MSHMTRKRQTAVCECISIAARIWSTTDWTPSSSESTSSLVGQCLELLVPSVGQLPADFAKQQSLEQLTGLSVERVCTLYLQCAGHESISGPTREVCMIFIVQLGDSGYRPDIVNNIQRRGLYTPQVKWSENVVEQLFDDPEVDQFKSASLKYWSAFFAGVVEIKLAEQAVNDGMVSCLCDWSVPSSSGGMDLQEAKGNGAFCKRRW